MKQLQKKLEVLGLSNSESKILTYVVEHGYTTVYRIKKEIELPRQTIYSILERLVYEGLVTYSDKSGTRLYSSSIEVVQTYIKQKVLVWQDIGKKLNVLEKSVTTINKKVKNKLGKARYFSGEYGLAYLFDSVLKDLSLPDSKKVFIGFGVNSYQGTGIFKVLKRFIAKRSKLGVKTRLIISNREDDLGIISEGDSLGRKVKKIDIDEQQAGCYIVDDVVYVFSYQDQVGIRIEHEHISKLLTSVFENTWKNN